MRLIIALLALVGVLLAACAPYSMPQQTATPAAYRLDSGDRLRVTVFGQTELTASYTVDPSGLVALPLIGQIQARGLTTAEFDVRVTQALQNGFLRDPDVTVEVEQYRPFFILGEVRTPGQYSYVAGLTAEIAVAIAGGFTTRAVTSIVDVARVIDGRTVRGTLRIGDPVYPGDVITVRVRLL
jgi:polysaccharide export outer membrane protein